MGNWLPKEFVERKKLFLGKLEIAKRNKEVDEDILDLLDIINSIPFIYTTSSCSGRIMLIDVPDNQRKEQSKRIAKWHKPVSFNEMWKIIESYNPQGVLWLKQEAFIVAFAVSSVEWASYLVRLARLFGFKESGIRSINLIAKHIFMDISSTEKLHVPVSYGSKGLVITKRYGEILVETANKLLLRTKQKLNLLRTVMMRLSRIIGTKEVKNPKDIGFKAFLDLISKSNAGSNLMS